MLLIYKLLQLGLDKIKRVLVKYSDAEYGIMNWQSDQLIEYGNYTYAQFQLLVQTENYKNSNTNCIREK